jgi:hypothetical protein
VVHQAVWWLQAVWKVGIGNQCFRFRNGKTAGVDVQYALIWRETSWPSERAHVEELVVMVLVDAILCVLPGQRKRYRQHCEQSESDEARPFL